MAYKISWKGLLAVAAFEGFRSKPYQDIVGVWTVGYGETRGVGPHTKPVSRVQALRALRRRINEDYAPALWAANRHLKQPAVDGFLSFIYNVGPGGVASSTTVGRLLRQGHWGLAANAILAWNKAGGRPVAGLTRRRQEERKRILSTA